MPQSQVAAGAGSGGGGGWWWWLGLSSGGTWDGSRGRPGADGGAGVEMAWHYQHYMTSGQQQPSVSW